MKNYDSDVKPLGLPSAAFRLYKYLEENSENRRHVAWGILERALFIQIKVQRSAINCGSFID